MHVPSSTSTLDVSKRAQSQGCLGGSGHPGAPGNLGVPGGGLQPGEASPGGGRIGGRRATSSLTLAAAGRRSTTASSGMLCMFLFNSYKGKILMTTKHTYVDIDIIAFSAFSLNLFYLAALRFLYKLLSDPLLVLKRVVVQLLLLSRIRRILRYLIV